ncbi:ankyrin repeat domain-containing protein [bacterium SCSIO 12741]|nr:ankyrin repeat domain-containing protein [bacterium SCSIO 12741]
MVFGKLFGNRNKWSESSDEEKYMALKEAINSGSMQELKKRTREGLPINTLDPYSQANILMFYASKARDLRWDSRELIAFLKSEGVDLNHFRNNRLKGSTSALHFAVIQKNEGLVKALVKEGASVDLKDGNGNTPLWKAVMDYRGEPEMKSIIHFLIEQGSSLDEKNDYGNSPRDMIIRVSEGIKAGINQNEWDLSELLG